MHGCNSKYNRKTVVMNWRHRQVCRTRDGPHACFAAQRRGCRRRLPMRPVPAPDALASVRCAVKMDAHRLGRPLASNIWCHRQPAGVDCVVSHSKNARHCHPLNTQKLSPPNTFHSRSSRLPWSRRVWAPFGRYGPHLPFPQSPLRDVDDAESHHPSDEIQRKLRRSSSDFVLLARTSCNCSECFDV
jgi:hypothetical protein